jgi:DNA mismatch repair protein MutS
MEPTKVTPMMQQYLQIKERYSDAILFFRLGDFYEMFFEDAYTASKILDIALTSRNKSDDASVPLCGVPYHSVEPYIQKLLDAGHKVAVCEQVEDPVLAKGVVKREVVRVITPGTVTASEALDARGNNFLAAVCHGGGGFGLALTDITTGEFRCTQIKIETELLDELGRIRPSEILLPSRDSHLRERLYKEYPWIHYSGLVDESFSELARGRVARGAGSAADDYTDGIRAASAILQYLETNAADSLRLLSELKPYAVTNFLLLDDGTRANLELVANYQGERKGSLLAILDRASTAGGARRLRQWLLYPLLDAVQIRERHDGVEELLDDFALRQDLKLALEKVQDLERLAGRAVAGTALPRDLVAVKETLRAVIDLREQLRTVGSEILVRARADLDDLPDAASLIERAIIDDPPSVLSDGSYIRSGFDAELDEIRQIRSHAKDWIAQFEAGERRRTGINSLKVRYNRVFGFYIEVTNANLKAVPGEYIRKQTLSNGERYITPELKEYEAKVLNAESLIEKMATALLTRVREQIAGHYPALKSTANALALLDVLVALADVAASHHFSRPQIDDSMNLSIHEGRHPVVESAVGRGAFVPNDCVMEPDTQQIILLTGPNMAGKSTYMRQVALIVILAQMGSFVPCAEAKIGMVDRVFTRIGAADSLARGESTFMVEMKETANILHHATARSLVLLDEVGRGTSTFDGISIAWAVAESLHDAASRPRTLFATHYHELTQLVETKERIKNFNFAVKEWRGEIIFLRNLIPGAASHSYGIHVARLAGMPAGVIERAKQILQQLEGSGGGAEVNLPARPQGESDSPVQMGLFAATDDRYRERLAKLDVTRMTPMEALNLLHELAEAAKK